LGIEKTYVLEIEKNLRCGDTKKATSWRWTKTYVAEIEKQLRLGDRKKPTLWRSKKTYVVEIEKNLRLGDRKNLRRGDRNKNASGRSTTKTTLWR
jgi:hypothetical protein